MKRFAGCTLLSCILFAPSVNAANLFVDLTSPHSVPPYVSWDVAAHSIQAAVTRAAAGDTIYVNGGSGTKVYTGSNADPAGGNNVVVLTKNVAVVGVGNPIVDGGGAVRGAYLTAGQMSGFTIRQGAAYEGGGAYVNGGSLRNSVVVSNTAAHGGGGIYLYSGNAINCLVARNNGGVFFNGGTLVNCTVAGNSGSGLYLEKNAGVFNCVAWSNSTNWRLSTVAPANSVAFFYNNCTTPAYSGGGEANGNITSPPNFQDYAAGNYRLGPGTSCLNGGLSQPALGYGATDLDGNPREVNRIDIGAYETPLPAGPAADAYEPDDSAAAAQAIANGQTQNRTLHGPNEDVDWIKFTVPNGGAQNVVIETDGPSGGDTVMWLYDGSAQQVGYDDDSGTGNFSLITTAALGAGTYYLRVVPYSGATAYALRVGWTGAPGAGDAYEYDGSATAAQAIANGQAQNHSMHVAGDVDWVKFTIGAAGASNVRVETSGASGDTHLWLFGPNNASTLVAYDNDSGTGSFSLITRATLAAGTYYVGIRENGDNATIAAYSLQVSWTAASGPTPDAYEYDGSATAAKAIANGQIQNHSIHAAGDVDWVKFTVGGAGAANVRVETAGASGDTHMWLFGPNSAGTLVAYNDDKGGGNMFSLITAASLPPGTYYLGIREYGDNAAISAYTVQASWSTPAGPSGDAYEYDGSATAAKAIANGQSQNRSIQPVGEVDWAKFTVSAPGASNVRIETSGAAGDTQIWLFGPNNAGTLVAYNDDRGSGNYFSLITAASLAPGTYYVGIREYGNDAAIPAYTLQANWATP